MTASANDRILRSVLLELARDPRVSQWEVGVQVHNGVVTLTGVVGSFAKKVAACEAAHRVAEVLDVANNLQVKNIGQAGPTDTDIALAVREALLLEPAVHAGRISTTIAHGMVSLFGTVETVPAREIAEDIVRKVDGVLEIINLLQVASTDDRTSARQGAEISRGRDLQPPYSRSARFD